MAEIAIVGIGNPHRGDDVVGWEVVERLEIIKSPSITYLKMSGDIALLIDVFNTHRIVYLIDACQGRGEIGKWQRIDLKESPNFEEETLTSTHGFGVSQAIAMARNLDMLPDKLILYAIYGERYGIGIGYSEDVRKSIEDVANVILNEEDIQTCMNKV